jgi:glutathione S-transferase
MPDVKLYMFDGSNAVWSARLMLEHKRIAYSVVRMLPALHALGLLVRGFETMSVPAITIDGRRVQGTRAISRALDELVPEPGLFPDDPVRRREVEDAERWGEGFQNATRRIFYAGARRDRAGFLSFVTSPARPVARRVITIGAPLILRMASAAHRATDEAARDDIGQLPERLDQIDDWIADGVLDGPDLNAADYQIAVNVLALLSCDDLAPFVESRPAARFARRIAPSYGGRVGPVMPPEWLALLER